MIHQEMDIDHEWILINQDDGKKIHGGKRVSDTKLVFLTDYFDEQQRQPQPPKVVVPVSFPLEPKEINNNKRVPIDFTSTPTMILEKIKEAGIESVAGGGGGGGGGGNKEVMTQVSFRKPSYNNNNESVDMTNKMDSPRSTTKGGNMIIPQIDATGTFDFDDESEVLQNLSSPKIKEFLENKADKNKDVVDDDDDGGLNLWKLSLNGIGAICSFGVAAATFCIIVFGSQQRHKHLQEQNQKLLFQRYTDDKRIKQVVRHTTKLNDAISAVRGVPITRAHITFGGYYDGI